MTADTIRIKGKPFAVRRVVYHAQHNSTLYGPLVVDVQAIPVHNTLASLGAAAPCLAERHPWAVAPAVQAAGDD